MAWIPSSSLGPVCERVTDAIDKEYTVLPTDVKEKIKKMALRVTLIRAVLQDAERKQAEDASVSIWLRSLKQILFDAEDVLDEVATDEALQRITDASASRPPATTSKRQKVCDIIIPSTLPGGGISYGQKIARRIEGIEERFGFLSDQINILGLVRMEVGSSSSSEIRPRGRLQTSSLLGINEPHIIARDVEKKKIERLLLSEYSAEGGNTDDVHVIAVVGMGGVGKTTLVKHAYNNPAVRQHFEPMMWVCVSNDFDVMRITKEITDAVCISEGAREPNEISNWDVAKKCLRDKLKGKRFLLVLDDVWEKDHSKWDSLCTPLMCGGKGSKIVVTTRRQEVADLVGGTRISLRALSNEDLWPIFKRYAFRNYHPKKHSHLEPVGREIVKKLKGLPLAAKTIGRLLNAKLDLGHWKNVLEAKAWLSQPGEDNILEVLKLSYDYLPGNLKRCFAYCSIFPQDYRFDSDELVQLWMAQQFIEHDHRDVGSITNVGRGGECFDGLVHACLLEPYMGTDEPYVMHDLVQNLAEKVSEGDCFRFEGGNHFDGNSTQTIRHVSIATSESVDPMKQVNELCKFENTRTLLFLRGCLNFQLDSHHLDELFTKLQRLRVLGLHYCKIEELPTSIGTLKHLRYLALSHSYGDTCKLPESLCSLFNLQMLKLAYVNIEELPTSIGTLGHLRFLDLSGTRISKLPESLCNLVNLQVLYLKEAKIEELPTSIGTLTHLRFLDLSNTRISKLPESVCNLLNLQVLDFSGCKGLRALPENMSALINLRHLYLYHGQLVSSIRGVGKLTALQELYSLDCARQNIRELAGMDELRELRISSLEEVESGEEASESRLDEKVYLEELGMTWTRSNSTADHPGLDEEVLQSLEPPSSSLRRLSIVNYGGIRSPGWMDDQSWLSSSSSLERLGLRDCTNWEVLPPLGQLPCLKFLHITGMGKVRRLGPRFIGGCCCYAEDGGVLVGVPGGGGGGGFPLLEELEFRDMGEWEEWEAPVPVPQQQQQQQQPPLPHPQQQQIITYLPCLRKLVIRGCPKLRQLPPLPPALTDLQISEVGLTHLPGWGWLPPPSSTSSSSSSSRPSPALSSLSIEECPNLTSLADGLLRHPDLHNLRKLKIKECQDLVSLPEETALGHLTSLEELHLWDCPKLSRPPTSSVEQLPLPSSLKHLSISGCDQVVDVLLASGVQHLTSLTDIAIGGRCRFGRRQRSAGEYSTSDDSYSGTLPPGLMLRISSNDELDDECLSTLLRDLTSLTSLFISDCPVITSLPTEEVLSHLTALRYLSIRSSRGLKSLGGIHSLVSLQNLRIDDCPELLRSLSIIGNSGTPPPLPPSLRELTISSNEELDDECLSTCLRGLPSRGSLSISGPVITRAEVLSHLTALRSLSVSSSPGLKSLGGIHSLVSLESLTIDGCPQLQEIMTVTCLRGLEIGRSSVQQMEAWLLRCPSLQELRIRHCPQLEGFGTGEGDHDDDDDGGGGGGSSLLDTGLLDRLAPALRRLEFWHCQNLRSLPPNLRCLSSLELLGMCDCPQIRSLPAGGLPESLRSLRIRGCPALVERCWREEGADWHLISHIGELQIGF